MDPKDKQTEAPWPSSYGVPVLNDNVADPDGMEHSFERIADAVVLDMLRYTSNDPIL